MGKNFAKTARLAERAAKKARKLFAFKNYITRLIFLSIKMLKKDPLTETIPGFSTEGFKKIAKKYGVVIIAPLYEKDKKASTITPRL